MNFFVIFASTELFVICDSLMSLYLLGNTKKTFQESRFKQLLHMLSRERDFVRIDINCSFAPPFLGFLTC